MVTSETHPLPETHDRKRAMLRRCHAHSARLHICNKAAFDQLDNPTQPAVIKAAAAGELRGCVAEKSRWHSEQLTKNGFKLAG
jgi:hypothetical protein